MSLPRQNLYKTIIEKFTEWSILTPQNISAAMKSNLPLISKVTLELIEVHPDVVLHQSDVDIMIKHPHMDKIHAVLLELKQANLTLNQNSLDMLMKSDLDRLNALILFLKHGNVFETLTQSIFDNFMQQAKVSFPAKQLINLLTEACFFIPKQDVNEVIYEDYFIHLEACITESNVDMVRVALSELIASHKKQSKDKIELLLLVEKFMDKDLVSVIKMRQKLCQEKNHALIVLPDQVFRAIIQTEIIVFGITKLSFLHHNVSDKELEKIYDFSYRDHVGNYTKHMPDLKEIVLRGCSSVEPNFDNYKLKMLKSYQDIRSMQVQATTLLISQKEEKGIFTTYVKYNKNNLLIYTNIPPCEKLEDFSVDDLKKIASHSGVTLEANHPFIKKDPDLMDKFYSSEYMTCEEIQLAKKMITRARTENRNDFGNKSSMASYVMQVLIEAGYHGTLKGYLKGYDVIHDRIVPVHGVDGIDKFPKAIRVKIPEIPLDEKLQQNRYLLFNPDKNPRSELDDVRHIRRRR